MAQPRPGAARPLSPHLQVYRFSLLMAMSILHRITGAALYMGTLIVVWWLVALAAGPEAYATFQRVALSPIGLLILFGYTWALMHHMMGGVRHLIWDTGASLEVPKARALTATFAIVAGGLTLLVWVAAMMLR
jgi:succinate dehydrogenase / fumarate reductase, cytochrome b subunit